MVEKIRRSEKEKKIQKDDIFTQKLEFINKRKSI